MSLRSVAVVGGGPVGLALGLSLQRAGIDCVVLDARTAAAARNDRRVLALSHASCLTLQRLNAWNGIEATPIATIHVSQQGSLGRTLIRAAELRLAALGHVAPAGSVATALAGACQAAGVEVRHDVLVERADLRGDRIVLGCRGGDTAEIPARLAAWADGRIDEGAGVVARDYAQQAIVAQVDTRGGHEQVAYERFCAAGAIALLPQDRGHAVVCSSSGETAAAWLADDDAGFLARLESAFCGRLRFDAVGARQAFPLALRYRRGVVGTRAVWLGNAAQTLHPIAGQGFNLALRDVTELARRLRDQRAASGSGGDCGAARLLAGYAAARRADRLGAIGFTDALVRVFGVQSALVSHARGAGLLALDLMPAARRLLARHLIFGACNGS